MVVCRLKYRAIVNWEFWFTFGGHWKGIQERRDQHYVKHVQHKRGKLFPGYWGRLRRKKICTFLKVTADGVNHSGRTYVMVSISVAWGKCFCPVYYLPEEKVLNISCCKSCILDEEVCNLSLGGACSCLQWWKEGAIKKPPKMSDEFPE